MIRPLSWPLWKPYKTFGNPGSKINVCLIWILSVTRSCSKRLLQEPFKVPYPVASTASAPEEKVFYWHADRGHLLVHYCGRTLKFKAQLWFTYFTLSSIIIMTTNIRWPLKTETDKMDRNPPFTTQRHWPFDHFA